MQHCSPRSLQTPEQTLSIHFYGMPPTACESKASAKKTNQQNVYIGLFSGYFCDELCAVIGEPSTPVLSHLILMNVISNSTAILRLIQHEMFLMWACEVIIVRYG